MSMSNTGKAVKDIRGLPRCEIYAHNSNISKGYMFPETKRLRGSGIDAVWAKIRARWEPVVEVTQTKGNSETHPSQSPEDSFADFEEYPHYIQQPTPTPINWVSVTVGMRTCESARLVNSTTQAYLHVSLSRGVIPM